MFLRLDNATHIFSLTTSCDLTPQPTNPHNVSSPISILGLPPAESQGDFLVIPRGGFTGDPLGGPPGCPQECPLGCPLGAPPRGSPSVIPGGLPRGPPPENPPRPLQEDAHVETGSKPPKVLQAARGSTSRKRFHKPSAIYQTITRPLLNTKGIPREISLGIPRGVPPGSPEASPCNLNQQVTNPPAYQHL